MGKSRNSFFGGPMNVGAYRNYPYYAAPRVWKHAAQLALIAFGLGMVIMLYLVQKNPELQELKTQPKPTVTVTHTHLIEVEPR